MNAAKAYVATTAWTRGLITFTNADIHVAIFTSFAHVAWGTIESAACVTLRAAHAGIATSGARRGTAFAGPSTIAFQSRPTRQASPTLAIPVGVAAVRSDTAARAGQAVHTVAGGRVVAGRSDTTLSAAAAIVAVGCAGSAHPTCACNVNSHFIAAIVAGLSCGSTTIGVIYSHAFVVIVATTVRARLAIADTVVTVAMLARGACRIVSAPAPD